MRRSLLRSTCAAASGSGGRSRRLVLSLIDRLVCADESKLRDLIAVPAQSKEPLLCHDVPDDNVGVFRARRKPGRVAIPRESSHGRTMPVERECDRPGVRVPESQGAICVADRDELPSRRCAGNASHLRPDASLMPHGRLCVPSNL